MLSCVLITPVATQAKANLLAEFMGWGSNSYSVPLTTGTDITHYGLHTWATEEFAEMLQAAGEGTMPPELEAAGYPAADFTEVVGSLITSLRDDMDGHFNEVCEANQLSLVTINPTEEVVTP